ncbi:polyketide synthase, partial [Plesiocystis pacifica SIR-1]
CELHVVHLPGRGARTGEAIPMAIEDYVAPIVEAILALPPRPTACLGHCLGAMFMVEVAAVLEHEHGFVLEHAFASAAPPPDHYFPSTAVFDHSDETVLGTLLAIGFTGTQALVDDPELRTLVLPAVRGDFEFAAHYSAQDHLLSPISAPLTVLTGLHDWFAAPQPMPRWAELTRGHCELHLLEDGHHYFIESHREHVQALVLDTLEGRPRQRGPFEAVPMDRWTMRTRPRRGSSVELHMARRKPNWSWTWRRRAHAVGGAARILVLLPGLFDTPCPVSEVEALDPDVAVLALEGLDLGGQALENGVALLAAELAQPQGALGSLILAGHGFGAIVAFELARRLGGGIQSLVAINSAPPHESFQSHTHHAGDAFLTQLMHLAGRPDSAGEMNFARVKRNLITAARYTHDLRAYASREERDALPPIRAFCAEHDFLSSRHLVQRWSALGEDVELVYTTGDHFTPVPARDLVP